MIRMISYYYITQKEFPSKEEMLAINKRLNKIKKKQTTRQIGI